jgi:hypothetical protein
MHGEQFLGPTYDTLVECIFRSAGSYVASPSRESDRQNPTRDEDGKLGQLLSQQYGAFRNKHLNPVQQKFVLVVSFRN